MRNFQALTLEVGLVAAATMLALLLRDNFEASPEHVSALTPYLLFSAGVSAAAFLTTGSHRSLWRHASVGDSVAIAGAATVTALGAMGLCFSYNRLDGVPRSLPLLQILLIVACLGGVRVLARLMDALAPGEPSAGDPQRRRTVLVVGVGRLADLYSRCVCEIAAGRVEIAGFLSDDGRHVGRQMRGAPIVGRAESVAAALRTLETHGVLVDVIVVAADFDALSEAAQEALLAVERDGRIRLEFLTEQLALALQTSDDEARPAPDAEPAAEPALQRDRREREALAARSVWRVKRLLDIALASTLLALCAPVMALVAVCVAIDVGAPVTFWQLRPGLRGRNFRLYKFRTMRPAHDEAGRRQPDALRLSAFGAFLRRTRLDELPQLVNILRGDMSFIGPRPLLPADQPADCAARLLVRPGLTGWAQVHGGRHLSINDKTALDLWYLRNATLRLDAAVALRTARTVLFGESVDPGVIEMAWSELRATQRADDY
jgi:lipopolysaccharide/colanic/teichoic acid biosynthesis glycosyltransferase